MREARQQVRVEAYRQPATMPADALPGPALHRARHREAGQREADPDQQVVDEHRRRAGPLQRRADDAGTTMCSENASASGAGWKIGALEQVRRVARQLMRDPRDDPGVERRVVVVEPRQVRRIARQRPGVQRRQRREQR